MEEVLILKRAISAPTRRPLGSYANFGFLCLGLGRMNESCFSHRSSKASRINNFSLLVGGFFQPKRDTAEGPQRTPVVQTSATIHRLSQSGEMAATTSHTRRLTKPRRQVIPLRTDFRETTELIYNCMASCTKVRRPIQSQQAPISAQQIISNNAGRRKGAAATAAGAGACNRKRQRREFVADVKCKNEATDDDDQAAPGSPEKTISNPQSPMSNCVVHTARTRSEFAVFSCALKPDMSGNTNDSNRRSIANHLQTAASP